MFTGIVEELGEVVAVDRLPGDAARLTVSAPSVTRDAQAGDSIAVDGVCLTATLVTPGWFTADVMKETLDRSTLEALAAGDPVNLERAATLQTRLGGHLVQGHVDGTGRVLTREPAEHWQVLAVGLPPELARYLVPKGSVAVDGVSLTVISAAEDSFTVSLIPTTLERTTLGRRRPGDPVNVEVDVLAKYVERLLAAQHLERLSPDVAR
jgi:riboflavin synthase